MKAFEAKQATDKRVANLKYDMFIFDIKKEAKEYGKYSISYFLDNLHNLGIFEGALKLISERLEEEGFHTEYVLEVCDFLKEFIIEWDSANKQFSIAMEAKELADKKVAEQNYEKLNKEVSHLAKNSETYEATYHIDDLYNNGIKPRVLEKIALLFCKDGFDTRIDYSTNCFMISWKHVKDDNTMGIPTFIE